MNRIGFFDLKKNESDFLKIFLNRIGFFYFKKIFKKTNWFFFKIFWIGSDFLIYWIGFFDIQQNESDFFRIFLNRIGFWKMQIFESDRIKKWIRFRVFFQVSESDRISGIFFMKMNRIGYLAKKSGRIGSDFGKLRFLNRIGYFLKTMMQRYYWLIDLSIWLN